MPGNDNQQQAGENAVLRQGGSLPLPKTFDSHAANWKKWCQRFDRYHVASGLFSLRHGRLRRWHSCHTLHRRRDNIVRRHKGRAEQLLRRQEKCCGGTSPLHWTKGCKDSQKPLTLSFKTCTRLQKVAITGPWKRNWSDRIVVGVADDDLSEQLQSKANLTLQEAVQLSRQTEARKESQPLIRESRSSAARDVDFIKKKPGAHKTHHHRRGHNAPSSYHIPPVHKKCMYCGRDQHAREACPAKSATCRACSKRGHYAMVCRSTKRPNHKTASPSGQWHWERRGPRSLLSRVCWPGFWVWQLLDCDPQCRRTPDSVQAGHGCVSLSDQQQGTMAPGTAIAAIQKKSCVARGDPPCLHREHSQWTWATMAGL